MASYDEYEADPSSFDPKFEHDKVQLRRDRGGVLEMFGDFNEQNLANVTLILVPWVIKSRNILSGVPRTPV